MQSIMHAGVAGIVLGPLLVVFGTRCVRDGLHCGWGGGLGGSFMFTLGVILIGVAAASGGAGLIAMCGVEGARAFRLLTSAVLAALATASATTGTVCMAAESACGHYWEDLGDNRGTALVAVGLGLLSPGWKGLPWGAYRAACVVAGASRGAPLDRAFRLH